MTVPTAIEARAGTEKLQIRISADGESLKYMNGEVMYSLVLCLIGVLRYHLGYESHGVSGIGLSVFLFFP